MTWNEADLLGFFFRHYDAWVDRYVVYDDRSTDGTLEMLSAHPRVVVRRFERVHAGSFVYSHQHLQNTCWKESRGVADWVVIAAVDEHLYVPGRPMREYLDRQRRAGTTAIPALGFQMIDEAFPQPGEWLAGTRTTGAPFPAMSKLSIFDPAALDETGFAPGRHSARPRGRLQWPAHDELLLLHYKYVGFERAHARHASLQRGLGAVDVARRLGVQYGWSRDQLRRDWDRLARAAVDLGRLCRSPAALHRGQRWWREPLRWRISRLRHRLRVRLL